MKYWNTLLILLVCVLAQAQPAMQIGAGDGEDTAAKYAETITPDDLRSLLTVIASDAFEGRETGTEGQRKAADFIANFFEEHKMPPIVDDSYFQRIVFTKETWKKIRMTVGEEEYRHLWDFYAFTSKNSPRPEVNIDEVLFLGYGIEDDQYNDYVKINVSGKALLIYSGEPMNEEGNSLVTGSEELSDWSTDVSKKLKLAKQKGAEFVFVIDPQLKENIQLLRNQLIGGRMRMGEGENPEENYPNNLFISSTMAKEILGKSAKKVIKARDKAKRKGKLRKAVYIDTDIQVKQDKDVSQLVGSNVLGYLEGSDPKLKEELIVVTAHYDHLGKKGDSIFNGADDNGSGSSTVLEVAEAFAKAKQEGNGPRRSVLFMLVSGEEKGLLGSQYYAEHPIFPIANTIANVNVDMVGRVDEKYADNPNYIYVIGSDRLSTELHDINESANKNYTNLTLDYTYNEDDDPNRFYYRSDHYNFAKKGIPAIFYFNGTHKDYHRPSDTVEKIEFDKMAKIGQLVFHTVWELANRDKRIVVNVEGRN